MAVELRFGHFADYATVDQLGKLILGGIFDIVHTSDPSVELIPVQFSLIASLRCSLADGLDHEVTVRLCDGEEQTIGNEIAIGTVIFSPGGPGRPYTANVLVRVAGVQVRGVDDYNFVIAVDGKDVGRIPLYVQLAPAQSDQNPEA